MTFFAFDLTAAGIAVGKQIARALVAAQQRLPGLPIDDLGSGDVARFMAIGAGHAAAAAGQYLQGRAQTAEHLLPMGDAVRLVGLLGAMRQQLVDAAGAGLACLVVGLVARRRLGGVTGDVLGASAELATTAALVAAVVVQA